MIAFGCALGSLGVLLPSQAVMRFAVAVLVAMAAIREGLVLQEAMGNKGLRERLGLKQSRAMSTFDMHELRAHGQFIGLCRKKGRRQ